MISYTINRINTSFNTPNNWDKIKIKYLLSSKVTDGPHETPTFLDEGIPFLSVDSIVNGKLVFDGCRHISKKDHDRYKLKCSPQKDDVFMGKAASIGKIAIVDVDFEFSIWSPLALLRPNQNKILPKFLEYALKSDYSQDQIDLYATSNTQKNISMDDIPRIELFVPNLDEQQRYINYLDHKTSKIDETISKNEKLIQLLEEKRTALINQVVTKGLNPNVKLKDSGIEWIGEIPEHWDVVPFKRLFNKIKDGTHGSFQRVDEGEYLLSAKNIINDTINISDNESLISESDYKSIISNGFPKKYDLLLTIVGTIGRSCVYDKDFSLAFQRSVAFIRLIYDNPYFYNYFVKSTLFYSQLMTNAKESAQKGVYLNDIRECLVIRPPLEIQNEISNYLKKETSKIDETISKIKENIDLLEEYKTSLIHHVVTGKVDVRGEVL